RSDARNAYRESRYVRRRLRPREEFLQALGRKEGRGLVHVDADLAGERRQSYFFERVGKRVRSPDPVAQLDLAGEVPAPRILVVGERFWTSGIDLAGSVIGGGHSIDDTAAGERFCLGGRIPNEKAAIARDTFWRIDRDHPGVGVAGRNPVGVDEPLEKSGGVRSGSGRQPVFDARAASRDAPREELRNREVDIDVLAGVVFGRKTEYSLEFLARFCHVEFAPHS